MAEDDVKVGGAKVEFIGVTSNLEVAADRAVAVTDTAAAKMQTVASTSAAASANAASDVASLRKQVSGLKKEVSEFTGTIRKFVAVGGTAATFYTLGKQIREAWDSLFTSGKEKAKEFTDSIDFTSAKQSAKALEDQLEVINQRLERMAEFGEGKLDPSLLNPIRSAEKVAAFGTDSIAKVREEADALTVSLIRQKAVIKAEDDRKEREKSRKKFLEDEKRLLDEVESGSRELLDAETKIGAARNDGLAKVRELATEAKKQNLYTPEYEARLDALRDYYVKKSEIDSKALADEQERESDAMARYFDERVEQEEKLVEVQKKYNDEIEAYFDKRVAAMRDAYESLIRDVRADTAALFKGDDLAVQIQRVGDLLQAIKSRGGGL